MWIVAPTPVTTRSIVLLSWSSVKPTGTLRAPATSIQINSAAAILDCVKIRQLHTKLTSTAATEIRLLTVFHRSVNSVITTALLNGVSSMIHGKIEFIGSLKFQATDVVDVGCLACPVECDENCKTYGYLGCCNRDDKEYEDLRVVIWQSGRTNPEPRERNKRQVCRIQHQFERHENNDDIAAEHHTGEPDCEKNAAYDQIIGECDHINGARVCSKARRQSSLPAPGRRRFEKADCNYQKVPRRYSEHRRLSFLEAAENAFGQSQGD